MALQGRGRGFAKACPADVGLPLGGRRAASMPAPSAVPSMPVAAAATGVEARCPQCDLSRKFTGLRRLAAPAAEQTSENTEPNWGGTSVLLYVTSVGVRSSYPQGFREIGGGPSRVPLVAAAGRTRSFVITGRSQTRLDPAPLAQPIQKSAPSPHEDHARPQRSTACRRQGTRGPAAHQPDSPDRGRPAVAPARECRFRALGLKCGYRCSRTTEAWWPMSIR